jgi:hypothetical protein
VNGGIRDTRPRGRGSRTSRVTGTGTPVGGFERAVQVVRAHLHEVGQELGVGLDEVPAPGRVAPASWATAGEVHPRGGSSLDEPLATGRLVVLHDPLGQEGWDGDTRMVAFVRASVEDDIARDPMIAEVAWAWLQESLELHGADPRALGGTVTVTTSRRFGLLASDGDPSRDPLTGSEVCEVEVRASWSLVGPCDDEALLAHLRGWCAAMSQLGGRPPSPPGVVAFPRL